MTMTQTPIHVSSNFFAKAARYFSNFGSAVTEILQNAYRASLPIEVTGVRPRVDVCVDTTPEGITTLTVRDYGKGITDIGAALSIAVSGWDASVEREQDPAGMGLCAALAFSDRAIIVSRFGTLEIHGKAFFNDSAYRDDLLNKIDSNRACEGVEITLHGIPGDTEVIRVVEETSFYHAALDVYMRKPGQPEQVKVRAFRDCFERVYDSEKKHFKFQGYEVWRDNGSGSRGFYPGDGELGVIWHGQRIQVRLNARELQRHFKFDDVEFDSTPQIASARGWCVAIDHGAAPVTPKLPDRESLILDEKTVAFIWGIYEPLFLHEVAELRKLFQARAIKYAKGELRFSEICYRKYSGNYELQQGVYNAFSTHYIGAPKVLWPVARSDDPSELEVSLLPRGERVAELAPMIVLKTLDSQVIVVGLDTCLDHVSDVSARFNFPADLPSWKLREGREDKLAGCHAIEGTAVPNGVCVSIDGIHGMQKPPGVQVALMVIDIPYKLADISTNGWGCRSQDVRVNTFIRLDEGVRGQIVFFDGDDPDALDDVIDPLREAGNTPMAFSDFAEIREKAVRQEDFILPAFAFYYGDDKDVHDCVWMGTLDEVVSLTNTVESTMIAIVESSGDAEDDQVKSMEEGFAKFRTEIARVAEISRPYQEILRICGLDGSRRNREGITSVCIDHEASKIAITRKDDHGVSSTLELSVDLG